MKSRKTVLIAAMALTAAAAWQSAALADEVVKTAAEDTNVSEFSVDADKMSDGGMTFEDNEIDSDFTVVEDGSLATAVYNIAQLYGDGEIEAAAEVLTEYDVYTRMDILALLAVENNEAYNAVIAKQYPEISELSVHSSSVDEMKTILRAVLIPNSVEPAGSFHFVVNGYGVVDAQSAESERTAEFNFDANQFKANNVLLSGEATYEFGMEIPDVCFSSVSSFTAVFTPDAQQ